MIDLNKIIKEEYLSPKDAIQEFDLNGILNSQQIGWLISMKMVDGFQLKRSSMVHREDFRQFLYYYYNRKNEALKAHIIANYASLE